MPEFEELSFELNKLRLLYEAQGDDVKKIAEVQAHHGQKLDDIAQALAPMKEIGDFVRRVASDHEQRIQELERRSGIQH